MDNLLVLGESEIVVDAPAAESGSGQPGIATNSDLATPTSIVGSVEVSNLYDHSFLTTPFEAYTVSEGLLLILIVLFLARSIIRVLSGKGV